MLPKGDEVLRQISMLALSMILLYQSLVHVIHTSTCRCIN